MANSKKTKTIDFEQELAPLYIMGFREIGGSIHRRCFTHVDDDGAFAICDDEFTVLDPDYKKGTQYSDICKECLKSYSMEEIKLLKHFLIVQKLKGK